MPYIHYNSSKEQAKKLSHFIGNSHHHVKNSLEFVKTITTFPQRENKILASFDLVSLFTQILVNLAIEVARQRSSDLDNITKWSVDDVCTGLRICLQATYLTFRGRYFEQIFGTAMASPVSVVVANLVMEDVEKRALENFSDRPKIWLRYVDDTFVIIEQEFLEKIFEHINKLEPSIKLTQELENDNKIPFLDTEITPSNDDSLQTTIYRKRTHSDRYFNFRSDHPVEHKRSMVNTLMHQARFLPTSKKEKKKEINHIKSVLAANSYPPRILEALKKNKHVETPEYKDFVILPYYLGLAEKSVVA